jgi:16S rRNA (guanine966-N2)-methyltransferase
VRITGGSLAGRSVACPPGEIRPAMDRMRASIFAVLGDLTGLSFLDLFSGSGIIGLEAFSRGAATVLLIEKDPGKRRTLSANAAIGGEAVSVRIMPVERFVMGSRLSFDLVFLDPPFPYRFKQDLLERIAAAGLVKPYGRLLIHYPAEENLPERVGRLGREDERTYGRSIVAFYRSTDS